jgi:sec-independent protein translocase protein TatB
MFNLGFSELLLLGLIALIFIGPSQLPEVARTIGRLINEWKRATSDFQSTITTHLTDEVSQRRMESQTIEQPHVQTPEEFAQHISHPGTHHEVIAEPAPELPVGAHPVSEDDAEKKS